MRSDDSLPIRKDHDEIFPKPQFSLYVYVSYVTPPPVFGEIRLGNSSLGVRHLPCYRGHASIATNTAPTTGDDEDDVVAKQANAGLRGQGLWREWRPKRLGIGATTR